MELIREQKILTRKRHTLTKFVYDFLLRLIYLQQTSRKLAEQEIQFYEVADEGFSEKGFGTSTNNAPRPNGMFNKNSYKCTRLLGLSIFQSAPLFSY